jgi:hypothetical protein
MKVPQKTKNKLGTVAYAYKPSYSGDRDKEGHSLRTAQAKSSRDSISTRKAGPDSAPSHK